MKKIIVFKSFLISLLYVGLGTLCIFASLPTNPFYGGWLYIGIPITLPANILGFAIAFSEKNATLIIFIVQFVVFLIAWYLINYYLEKRST